jgi:micrococcal nuclease
MYNYEAIVDRVIDGDTVDLSVDLGFNVWVKQRIRLDGIDTPEKNTNLGAGLTVYMKGLLEKKSVLLVVSKKDKFGRYLGKIFLGDTTSINDKLINLGLAKVYYGTSKVGVWTEEELAKNIDEYLDI